MQAVWIILLILAVLCAAYLWIVKGHTGNPKRALLDGHRYAHRGYHAEPDAPENSREAFRRAVARGFGAELDVHLLKDGTLAVMHDSELQRMTGRPGVVEDLTAADLANYTLGKSRETIPTFADVLDIFGGKTPLIIEVKTYRKNAAALCKATCAMLDSYPGLYCIESFDPRAVQWLRKNRPDIVRGQLSNNFMKNRCGLSRPLAFMATYLLANLFTRPDFIAYKFEDRKNFSNRICLKLWHTAGASWTLRTKADLAAAEAEGLWPIFENFDPEN
ncbi:MAG: glycerophosphodiester phosphodiesterase [Faecalibacterium sp.]|nr:glycerophosphodiester phosphodiesterase [Faecalibacterium sp.]